MAFCESLGTDSCLKHDRFSCRLRRWHPCRTVGQRPSLDQFCSPRHAPPLTSSFPLMATNHNPLSGGFESHCHIFTWRNLSTGSQRTWLTLCDRSLPKHLPWPFSGSTGKPSSPEIPSPCPPFEPLCSHLRFRCPRRFRGSRNSKYRLLLPLPRSRKSKLPTQPPRRIYPPLLDRRCSPCPSPISPAGRDL